MTKTQTPALLLAEPDPGFRRTLVGVLEGAGYRVTPTTTGTGALEFGRAHAFDLLILELMLPGLDGLQVFESLREEGRAVGTPILFLATRPADGSPVHYVDTAAGIYALEKPCTALALLEHVQEILRYRGETLPCEPQRSPV